MAQINTKRQATSTTAAVLLTANPVREMVRIRNEDATIVVRVGDSTVENAGGTAANVGYAIPALGEIVLGTAGDGQGLSAAMELYVISDSGTPAVSVFEYQAR